MTTNLSVKSVPDALTAALRERAARNHRSLQGELMCILEAALAQPVQPNQPFRSTEAPATAGAPGDEKLSIDEVAARAQRLFPNGTSSSAEILRAMRDNRNAAAA